MDTVLFPHPGPGPTDQHPPGAHQEETIRVTWKLMLYAQERQGLQPPHLTRPPQASSLQVGQGPSPSSRLQSPEETASDNFDFNASLLTTACPPNMQNSNKWD